MNDSNESIQPGDIETMLAANGQVLLALVLLQMLANNPSIWDNAGGGSRDLGRQLRSAALDQLYLLVSKDDEKPNLRPLVSKS